MHKQPPPSVTNNCLNEFHQHVDDVVNAITQAEAKAPEDLTEDDKIALLGRPKAGENVRAQLRIKESKEFKVSSNNVLSIS